MNADPCEIVMPRAGLPFLSNIRLSRRENEILVGSGPSVGALALGALASGLALGIALWCLSLTRALVPGGIGFGFFLALIWVCHYVVERRKRALLIPTRVELAGNAITVRPAEGEPQRCTGSLGRVRIIRQSLVSRVGGEPREVVLVQCQLISTTGGVIVLFSALTWPFVGRRTLTRLLRKRLGVEAEFRPCPRQELASREMRLLTGQGALGDWFERRQRNGIDEPNAEESR